ncbi:MAG: D-alanyl-D-alanine carboxypeptidase family protein [Akkermansiaceae bacterium]
MFSKSRLFTLTLIAALPACAQTPLVRTPTAPPAAPTSTSTGEHLGNAQTAAPVQIGTLPRTKAPAVAAPRAIVIDYASGRVLHQKNADERCAVASTQKLLTALCVLDTGNINKKFTITKSDTWVVPTKIGIAPGEVYTRRKLVGALLVRSGNDVARALARSVAGSEASFSTVMNRKARSLGMKNSHFLNPHGLTAKGQYSTARDMATCARAVFRSPTLRGIMSTRAYTFHFSNGRKKLLENTNKVMKRVPHCNGMKTGTTRASGRCLVCSGTHNGRTAIVVVLGATSKTIWNDSEKLLRWALERPAPSR